jgi:hypothetical protein
MYAQGAQYVGELDETSPFEIAAHACFEAHKRGELTDADLESLGLREDDHGGVWIRVGRAWGRG